jgi:serine/threonine-protein kinase
MPLSTGLRLGSYEIIAAIGAGGMGEVYRARDSKLHRDVAIKILPEAFAQDSERLARFSREAQVLASLNHPGIAHIYGVEESSAGPALVMELVDGPTLADRLIKSRLSMADALAIARQIADAVETAHEHGVIHRDLKPANIKVKDDGSVKVLDFGLAKAVEPSTAPTTAELSNSPTLTSPAATALGMILGTAAYMAPEQARGKVVDKRADIWAFGCLLYEMVTGRAPFAGDDVAETLGAVIHKEPDWSLLPSDA